jgi:hypothetical protein
MGDGNNAGDNQAITQATTMVQETGLGFGLVCRDTYVQNRRSRLPFARTTRSCAIVHTCKE